MLRRAAGRRLVLGASPRRLRGRRTLDRTAAAVLTAGSSNLFNALGAELSHQPPHFFNSGYLFHQFPAWEVAAERNNNSLTLQLFSKIRAQVRSETCICRQSHELVSWALFTYGDSIIKSGD